MRKYCKFFAVIILISATSCGAYFNQPFQTSKARIGENTSKKNILELLVSNNMLTRIVFDPS